MQVRLGELDSVSRSEGEEIGVRLFAGQRSATAASSDLSDEALALLVERCMAMALEAPEDPYAGLAPEDRLLRGVPPVLDSDDGREPDPAELRAQALEAETAALAVAGMTNSSGAGASASAAVIALATSGGFAGAYGSTGHGVSAAVVAGEGSAMQRDHAWHGVRLLDDLEPAELVGRRAGERAIARLNPARPKPGRYPVLFDPRVAGSLLGHFAGAITGGAVARKTSFLQDRLGQQVFAPGVTIIDDPLRSRGLRSRPFDAEGLAVARTELIATACCPAGSQRARRPANSGSPDRPRRARRFGCAGRGPEQPLSGRGNRSREELLAAFPEAVLVIELIGQGANPVTGDYSRGATGFMVRNGEIAEPVSEITIASNLIDMFAILEPASDLELRRGIDAPTILIPEMTVASA